MAEIKLLNNIDHQGLRVLNEYSADLGDNIASTITFITEFSEVQKEYPILFRKEPEKGEYQAIVLFGIQKDENLFLRPTTERSNWKHPGWDANYIPAVLARGPFSIGLQTQMENGIEKVSPMINIDMAHPKVNESSGERVFGELGGNSPYLARVINVLNLIRDGMQLNKAMFDAFVKFELLEDVDINIDLDNQDKFRIGGFQTINADKLQALPGDALLELNKAGFLQAAFFVVASLSNIQKLIEIKNRNSH